MDSFTLQIITPEKILFHDAAREVNAPGTLGDFGVLPGHAPFISTLRPGIVWADNINGERIRVAVVDGIAQVTPESCIILSDTARTLEGITAAEAQAAVASAREAVEKTLYDDERRAAEKRLLLAETVAASL